MKLPPIHSIFTTSDDRSWSFARVTSGLFVGLAAWWGTFVVYTEHKIPDFTSLAALIVAIYGINRGAEAYETRSQPPVEPTGSQ